MVKEIIHHKPRYIRQLLDDVGDTSGVKNFNGNYTGIPDYEARIVSTPGRVFQIHSLEVFISTLLTGAIVRNGYGRNPTGFFTFPGIRMYASEKNALGVYTKFVDFGGAASANPVLFHFDWLVMGARAIDDVAMRLSSPGEYPGMLLRFDFVDLFGAPLVLRGNREAKLAINVGGNNMAAGGADLTYHRFMVSGIDHDESIYT